MSIVLTAREKEWSGSGNVCDKVFANDYCEKLF
jgi:hypothetical protein